MVAVCTGSFRGVRDQPVTGHEGLKSCGHASLSARIRPVFGASVMFPRPCRLANRGLEHVDLSRRGASRGAVRPAWV
jgi:hypothetical protein